jgi:pilus assembly protein CpaB
MLKGWIPIAVAVTLGLAAFAAGYAAIRLREAEVTRGWDLVEVLVYKDSMRPGSVLTEDTLDVDVMPRRFFHQSVIMTPRYRGEALSKELLVHVEKGQPVQWYQLAGLREQELLASQVREGFRAVTIDVAEAQAVAYWITPNDAIDIVGTFRDPVKRELTTVTVLQNVSVLATGRTSSMVGSAGGPNDGPTDSQYQSVTVQVLPQEAEILLLAQEMGSLHMTLRNRSDQGVQEDRGRTTIDALLSGNQLQELERQRRHTIEIIRGLQKLTDSQQ